MPVYTSLQQESHIYRAIETLLPSLTICQPIYCAESQQSLCKDKPPLSSFVKMSELLYNKTSQSTQQSLFMNNCEEVSSLQKYNNCKCIFAEFNLF